MAEDPFLDALRRTAQYWKQDVIKYYFGDKGTESWQGDYNWAIHEKQALRQALRKWADVANLEFSEVKDARPANLIERLQDHIPDAVAMHGLPPINGGDRGDRRAGDYWHDWGAWTVAALRPAGEGFETVIHELGHAIGLSHPHYDKNDKTSPTFPGVHDAGDLGDNNLNQTRYTIMSYNRGPNDPVDMINYGHNITPMAFDIAAVQALYGKNRDANVGPTTYYLPDDNKRGTGYTCIWDAKGSDTIQYDGNRQAVIDLQAATLDNSPTGGGVLSRASGVYGGFTIANNVVIENAVGGSNRDDIRGNGASNALNGRGQADKLVGRGGNDRIEGQAGNDQIWGSKGNDTLYGGTGDDRMSGGPGHDILSGGDGSDQLFGNGGGDTLIGGAGKDRLFGQAGADTLYGNGGNDLLDGGVGQDMLYGGNGDDRMSGGGGKDRIDGGDGIDTVDWSHWNKSVRVDLTKGTAVFPGFYTEVVLNLENAVMGPGNDRVTGTAQANHLVGGIGNDILSGGGGNDTLLGGAGSDVLIGGEGRDMLNGGAGLDTVEWGYNSPSITVDLENGNATVFGQGGDDLVSIENVTTGKSRDIVQGSSTDNTINVSSGNDTANGKAGDDILWGGGGLDYLTGGDGNDEIYGQADDDWLLGENGNDWIKGGDGNDNLEGGPGTDRLRGDGGVDSFVYNEGFGRDWIFDFEDGTDVLRLNDSIWGGGKTNQQVVDTYAQIEDGDLIFDFGNGNVLTLSGFGVYGGNAITENLILI